MSNKTSFKRLALGVVVALGLGFLSSAPSSAVVSSPSLVLSGAGATTNTAVVNESATAVTATVQFFGAATSDSMSVRAVVTSSAGTGTVKLRATSDSSNVTTALTGATQTACALADVASGCDVGGNDPMSSYDTMTVGTAGALVKQVYTVQAYGFSAAGTYTVTLSLRSHDTSSDPDGTYAAPTTVAFASFTITVAAASTEPTTIKTYTVDAGKDATAVYYKNRYSASTDSAVVVSTGTAGTYTAVATVYATLYASNGETRTGTALTNICNTACTVNVTIDRGYIDNYMLNGRGTSPSASETLTVTNTTSYNVGDSITV